MLSSKAQLRAGVLFLLILFGRATFCVGAEANSILLPDPGMCQLQVLTPNLLEITLITTKDPDPARPTQWDFVRDEQAKLPANTEFQVAVGGRKVAVAKVGFKRRVLYAPLKKRDLRIANYLYLELESAIGEGEKVEVSAAKVLPAPGSIQGIADPFRLSPVIHVNQIGYVPENPKKARLGYFLGSLGEWKPDTNNLGFRILEAQSRKSVFEGKAVRRPEQGLPYPSYEHVYEADFSALTTAGDYVLQVPGLGCSYPFFINHSVAALGARVSALGLYHQRCGGANELPYTRFVHGVCHANPVDTPDASHKEAESLLIQSVKDGGAPPKPIGPPMTGFRESLYPFAHTGKVNARGGHHDAGDYSKYTINSAGLVHLLMFSVDAFPGVAQLDNLGLPESGDGISDVLQEAKWEADFLANMQDKDGGFYFLVYPKERRYENEVLPDKGDPQIVWPKNTASTAAAVAALAQCASSPLFKRVYPEVAALYLQKATAGWNFLQEALKKYGEDGAYQKLTHYGHDFLHSDELAWAVCEMFLATGDEKYHKELVRRLNPADPETRRWGWWRLCEAYGHAIRSYGFAKQTGRLKPAQLDVRLLTQCEDEIQACGEDQMKRSFASAYGTSLPSETKRVGNIGWYFSTDAAFDLVTALQLKYPGKNDPRAKFREALAGNLDFTLGCNPVNMSYLTGVGWRRQYEIVHQYAQNDWRQLPPGGIPLGNVHSGFGWIDHYKQELGALNFPGDGAKFRPYPIYDRWGDSFNLSTEFVVLNQAKALGAFAYLMAQTPLRDQKWQPASAQIVPKGNELTATGFEPHGARVVWETEGEKPLMMPRAAYSQNISGKKIELEGYLSDGRLFFAATNLPTTVGRPAGPALTKKP